MSKPETIAAIIGIGFFWGSVLTAEPVLFIGALFFAVVTKISEDACQ